VIASFAALNAVAIGFLVFTIAQRWGIRAAIAIGVLCAVGPDAFISYWIWHPSLYSGALALLLTAGIRLRDGSVWWGAVVTALPLVYALIHYSGFALVGASLFLLVASRRRLRDLAMAAAVGLAAAAVAWVPFLIFEGHRGFSDFWTIVHGVD